MHPKDQLDNNDLEQNQELPGKELPDMKDNEITSNLDALETKVAINTIKEKEKFIEKKDTIEQTREEEERIKKEILSSKKNKHSEYIPGHITDETNTLELANAGRKSSAQNIKDNIQKYPGWLGGLIKSIDNYSLIPYIMAVIQSAGGIIYYIDGKGTPRFLIIKRHAMSGKIEWVAPKGKIQKAESPQQAAVREVSEEVGISPDMLVIESKIGLTSLRSSAEVKGGMDKDVTYFLMHYHGEPDNVRVQPVEGYLGIFKRATLDEVLGLIYYKNMREIFTLAHAAIGQQKVKKDFLDTII